MKRLCTVHSGMTHCTGDVDVVEWKSGDPFPKLGPCVGVDTETELITKDVQAPPVVVLGVFDPASMTCYVVYWRDVREFMRGLCARDVVQRYFNLGFDEQVLDAEDPDEQPLLSAVDAGRVVDMQIRVHLHEIATLGFIRYNMHSLAGCTLALESWQLDKGDGTEDSARLSFRRHNPDGSDYVITDEQAAYLPFDCISTWALGEAVPSMPSELVHTKGMVVLAHISANGMQVDRRVFEALESKLARDRDRYKDELIGFGFPDPSRDASSEADDVRASFMEQYGRLLSMAGLENGLAKDDAGVFQVPCKACLRCAVVYIYAHEQEPGERMDMAADLKCVLESGRTSLRKNEKDLYAQLCEDYGLLAVDGMSKSIVMPAYVAELMKAAADAYDAGPDSSYSFRDAVDAADAMLDSHPSWTSGAKPMGPRKFFQQHVQDLLERNEGLELETTEKSGEIKLTLKDMWRLSDVGVQDSFLESYTRYNHCVKLLSTYMSRDMLCSDWRVRPRFLNLLRTGRTACVSPNI